jgi:hypothetical protein
VKTYANARYAEQVGPEDWDMVTYTLEVSPDTPMGEVVAWAREMTRMGRKGAVHFMVREGAEGE